MAAQLNRSRRRFLELAGVGTLGVAAPGASFAFTKLQPIGDVLKGEYPYRGWEDL